VTNKSQQSLSKMRLGAAIAALTLAVMLVSGPATAQSSQTFAVLHKFKGGRTGANPDGSLVFDAAGNLFGTTCGCSSSYYGTVFKLDKNGTETVLYNFDGGPDGRYPEAGLVWDAKGDLYGTTFAGGSDAGTVFRVSKTGKETVLHSFAGGPSDGAYPEAGLVRDDAGNLYGTTVQGGVSGLGTVFKVTKTGKETVLHSFAGGSSDGEVPYGGLARDAKGNLYGTTFYGGDLSCGEGYGCGTAFKLSKSGTLTLLHSFGGATDGCYVSGTPTMDKNGDLYGTAEECGSSNVGIVWKVSKSGKETVLHNFAGGTTDGEYPYAGVITDAKGNLYGDTLEGGAFNLGTVYKLNKEGALTLLHSFDGSDGKLPAGNLIHSAKGDLYGTATEGGSSGGHGTVWKLTP
jgi:uncharacterized repeat protein (TIGR03803 family)